jgi:hypothetical protein
MPHDDIIIGHDMLLKPQECPTKSRELRRSVSSASDCCDGVVKCASYHSSRSTIDSAISDNSSSDRDQGQDQDRNGKAAYDVPAVSECSHIELIDDSHTPFVEPLLRQNADRFTFHPIR